MFRQKIFNVLRLLLVLLAVLVVLMGIDRLFDILTLPLILKPIPGMLVRWYVWSISLITGLVTTFWGWGMTTGRLTRILVDWSLQWILKSAPEFYNPPTGKVVERTIKLTHYLLIVLVGFSFGLLFLPLLEILVDPINPWINGFFRFLWWISGYDFVSTLIVFWTMLLFNIGYWSTNSKNSGRAK